MKVRCLLIVLLTISLISTSSCVTKTVLIRQSMSHVPAECNGALYVAQNKPIMVGIEGSDVLVPMDVGGYYLLHKDDLAEMVKRIKSASNSKAP